jgi:hypothetical protein
MQAKRKIENGIWELEVCGLLGGTDNTVVVSETTKSSAEHGAGFFLALFLGVQKPAKILSQIAMLFCKSPSIWDAGLTPSMPELEEA